MYLDGRFTFGASTLVLAARQIAVGQDLTDAEIELLKEDESAERAHTSALNYLSFRPRSTRELEDFLRRKGAEPRLIAVVIERLRRLNLVNDEEFARYWIENRQNFRPKGARALRAELRQKGLITETIDDALQDLGDETALALRAAQQKLASYRNLDDRGFTLKMIGFLQRRGFAYSVAAKTVAGLLEQRGGAQPDDLLYSESEPVSFD